jgi:lactoylglutathione lyase
LNFETAYNVYLGLLGDGDSLEQTANRDRAEPYDVGDGYNHMAVALEDLDATQATPAREDVYPEKPPYSRGGREDVGRISFVQDPDGYRIELIDDGNLGTPGPGHTRALNPVRRVAPSISNQLSIYSWATRPVD